MRKTRDEYHARLNELLPQITDADRATFDRIVNEHDGHMITLTPTLAAHIMTAHNSYNRPLTKFGNIAKLSAEISSGDFPVTGQGLSITTKGDLGDGQHRCAAVIHAGTSIPKIMVVSGVDQADIAKVDHNMTLRSLGDDLTLVNVENPTQKGRIAETIMRYNDLSSTVHAAVPLEDVDGLPRAPKVKRHKRVNYVRTDYIDFVLRNDPLLSEAYGIGQQSLTTPAGKQLARPAMMGAETAAAVYFLLVAAGHDEDKVMNYLLALQAFDEELLGGSEAWLLHSKAMSRTEGHAKNLPSMDLVSLGIHAGNYSLGATKKMGRWTKGLSYPKAQVPSFLPRSLDRAA